MRIASVKRHRQGLPAAYRFATSEVEVQLTPRPRGKNRRACFDSDSRASSRARDELHTPGNLKWLRSGARTSRGAASVPARWR